MITIEKGIPMTQANTKTVEIKEALSKMEVMDSFQVEKKSDVKLVRRIAKVLGINVKSEGNRVWRIAK